MIGKEMSKKSTPAEQENPWDAAPATAEVSVDTPLIEQAIVPQAESSADFDLEGLMTDFPTATDLERFVYDQTGIVLNLKGRANKLKYQTAMDVLNGKNIESKFIGTENPYIDRTELVPIDPIKDKPARDASLPPVNETQNLFISNHVPHPDFEARAQDKKVSVMFRKYKSGEISYEILGPLEQRPFGEKIDKFGRTRPEVIKWVDPRTGEQVIVREDGSMTPQGRKLRAMMQTFKVNKSNHWDTWIDREFVSLNDTVASNPWDLK
jgi:hypothetical protein